MSQANLDSFPILDNELLNSRKAIGDSMLPRIIDAFSLEVPKALSLMWEKFREGDITQVKKAGHKLKGMCVNIGALRLSELGRQIEEKEYQSFEEIMKDIQSVFEETQVEFSRVLSND